MIHDDECECGCFEPDCECPEGFLALVWPEGHIPNDALENSYEKDQKAHEGPPAHAEVKRVHDTRRVMEIAHKNS